MKTALKDDIYTIISSKRDWNGELQWINRAEIAQALDRPRKMLRPEDIIEIAQLVEGMKILRRWSVDQDTLLYRARES